MSNQVIQYLANNPEYFTGVIFLFGLMFGSFFNVVIYRVPVMMQLEWLENCRDFIKEMFGKLPKELEAHPESLPKPPFNIAKPDSTCPHCGHKIRWYENVPLASYVALKGKCSSCKNTISLRYPIIELVTALLSGFAAWNFGFGWETAAALAFTWALICLTMIDFDHKLLPDQITLPLMWLGLLLNMQGMFASLEDAVIGAVAGYMCLWSLYWAFKLLTGKEGMGYGDFKLLAALGAWMGWQYLLLILVLSSMVGAVVGISLIVIKGRDKNIPIPFGPYLAAAGWIAFFWGEAILRQYQRFLF
ncbi:prepilin peptidase [Ketobacter alkanivorans]|uniref:Prepilin leader peptidase/N-methyltransferase n=1 Tax=Ketobacter alkanivorans TaxID=1917421 RepID=A0A2K9LPE1_9GAMM|nr:A24 family peptidase [Ketobacter alkanivorans]AUM14107.1 prepilin peptidase [Ketobacter alkanivorans]